MDSFSEFSLSAAMDNAGGFVPEHKFLVQEDVDGIDGVVWSFAMQVDFVDVSDFA